MPFTYYQRVRYGSYRWTFVQMPTKERWPALYLTEEGEMPSMKCHHCGKTKSCRMHLVGDAKVITYVCAPCARDLGYSTSK